MKLFLLMVFRITGYIVCTVGRTFVGTDFSTCVYVKQCTTTLTFFDKIEYSDPYMMQMKFLYTFIKDVSHYFYFKVIEKNPEI
jgi:hypothetical protein